MPYAFVMWLSVFQMFNLGFGSLEWITWTDINVKRTEATKNTKKHREKTVPENIHGAKLPHIPSYSYVQLLKVTGSRVLLIMPPPPQ